MSLPGFLILLISVLCCCAAPQLEKAITCEYYGVQYGVGEVIEYTCPPGKRPKSSIGQCFYYGWGPPPTCEDAPYECTIPATSDLIRSPHQPSYQIGKRVSISCRDDFVRVGVSESFCTNEGWNPSLPTCQNITNFQCQIPDKLNLIRFPFKVKYRGNDKVLVKCEPGFIQNGTLNTTCTENGWNPPLPICEEPCRLDQNKLNENNLELDKVHNNDVFYADGEIIKFKCKSGFIHSGEPTGKCSGQTLTYPRCREIGEQCDPPPVVQFGDTTKFLQSSYQSGDFVEYKCPAYYVLKGHRIVRCLNGFWDEAPVCLEPCTARRRDMEENNIQPGWIFFLRLYAQHGDYINFRCKPGYDAPPTAQMRSFCKEGKLEYPKCYLRGTGEQCGPPPVVQFGDIATFPQISYRSGDSVEYKCPSYYVLKGNNIVRCWNGVWDEAPVCLEPCTAKVKDMDENNIQLRWTLDRKLYAQHGDTISFMCKSGYEAPPDTQMRIVCDQGKLEYPKCFKSA